MSAIYAARRRGVAIPGLLTAAAPAIPLAQSIGRLGNWWNQELFGRATTLPWALRISNDKLPAGYAPGTTFHPPFLYESLWNLTLCVVLLQIDRRYRLEPGRLFAVYLAAYFGAGSGSRDCASTPRTSSLDYASTNGLQPPLSWRRSASSWSISDGHGVNPEIGMCSLIQTGRSQVNLTVQLAFRSRSHACSHIRQASAHTRQCSCMSVCFSHSSAHNRHAVRHASSAATEIAALNIV